MKLIIDTDPGIDDALAILYASQSPDLELTALTTVFGNVTVDTATRNALWLAEHSGLNIPVARGAEKSWTGRPPSPIPHIHGPEGLGDFHPPLPRRNALKQHAADFLVQQAADTPGEITVCAVGPLTNIAMAIERDPLFIKNLKRLVVMGGSLEKGGNITEFAEANFNNDPHAAEIVLKAKNSENVMVVGLDVTTMVRATPTDFERLAHSSPVLGGFLREISKSYMRFHEKTVGEYMCYLHDPMAVIACHRPELFCTKIVDVTVVTEGQRAGMMIPDSAKETWGTSVCIGVESDALLEVFLAGFEDRTLLNADEANNRMSNSPIVRNPNEKASPRPNQHNSNTGQ